MRCGDGVESEVGGDVDELTRVSAGSTLSAVSVLPARCWRQMYLLACERMRVRFSARWMSDCGFTLTKWKTSRPPPDPPLVLVFPECAASQSLDEISLIRRDFWGILKHCKAAQAIQKLVVSRQRKVRNHTSDILEYEQH